MHAQVLMVDFPDLPGTLPQSHYESMLFSEAEYPTGSMNDFFKEASANKAGVEANEYQELNDEETNLMQWRVRKLGEE